jgi:hypothetical protein
MPWRSSPGSCMPADRSTLAFTVDVQHAHDLAEAFQAVGDPGAGALGPDAERTSAGTCWQRTSAAACRSSQTAWY